MISVLVNRGRLVLTAAFLFSLMGAMAYLTMPRQEDPVMPDYWANITAVLPGADAETVERLLLEPIEEHLAEVDQIENINANAFNELVLINVELSPQTDDMDQAWLDVREALEAAQPDFPEGVAPPIMNNNLNDQESIVLSVTGHGDPLHLLDAARDLKKEFLGMPMVSKVRISGDPGEQITIEYDDAQAARLGLDPRTMAMQLSARNNIIPGGSIKMANRQVTLRPKADFTSVEEIRNTPIILPNGAAVPLSEVAVVRKGPAEPANEIMRVNGQQAVGIGIVPRKQINILDFGESVKARLAEVAPLYEPLNVEMLIFQPRHTDARLSGLTRSLMLGIGVVAGVLLLFMGVRLGLVVASVIPLVALSSVAVYALGGGLLQQMSISALVIALGMLVDNAIVMAENIQWRIDHGEPREAAALNAIKELAAPLASATGTTLAAFVPMLLARSITADFTRSLPIVIMLTLTVSYLFAVFVTPTFAKLMLRKRKGGDKKPWLGDKLGKLSTKRPLVVVLSAFVIVSVSFYGMGFLKQQFFPSTDRDQFVVEVKMPEGTHLEVTNQITAEMENALLSNDKVTLVHGYVGRSAPHFYYNIQQVPWSPHFAQIVVNTQTPSDVDDVVNFVREFAATNLPDAEIIPRTLEQGPPIDNPIEVRLYGNDLETLNAQAELVTKMLQGIEGTRDVRHDLSLGSPSLRFDVNDAAAARAGLSRADVAVSLFGKTRGLSVGQFRSGEDPVPVVLRSAKGENLSSDALDTLEVSSLQGMTVPLGQVAVPRLEWRPAVINHHNRQRFAKVSSQLMAGVEFSQVQQVLEPMMADLELPPGIRFEYGGLGEGSAAANKGMALTLPLGLILLLGILLAEFNSFRRLGIVMVTVPLAAAGVVPGLLFSNSAFGFMSLLGVIALVGIVVNNAIVLLDVIDHQRLHGKSLEDAVREGVLRRTRPILLTTTTTVTGLLPLALSGSSLWPPMAWAIISGLIASTLLTLLVVPSLYILLFRKPKFSFGRKTPTAAAAALMFLVVTPPALRAADDGANVSTVTLAEAMAAAVVRPESQAARAAVDAAEADAEAARRAGLLPAVGGQAVQTHTGETINLETPVGMFELGSRNSTAVDVQVVQPLYDPVNRKGDLPAAQAAVRAADARAGRTDQQLRFAAAAAWLAVADIDAQIDATKSFQTSLNDRLEEVRARVREGRTIESEALKLELDLAAAERDLFRLDQARMVAVLDLGRAIGKPQGADIAGEPKVDLPTPDQPKENLDFDKRLDLQSLRDEREAVERLRDGIAAERLPKVEAGAAYSWADGDPFRDGSRWQATLQVSWTPFASGTRKPRMAAAAHRARALEQQLEAGKRQAVLELHQADANLRTAYKSLDVAERSLVLAEETLRVERARYDQGRATTNDLLEAESDRRGALAGIALAKNNLIRAHFQRKLAKGEL